MANKKFGDKEMMDDALASQKFITSTYNTFANECASDSLKSEFMNILADEHSIQHEIFKEMQNRGWYAPEQAEQSKIINARTKYENQNPSQN
ncbi:MAG: spore coat protein [Oscillospiraceae bacterium]